MADREVFGQEVLHKAELKDVGPNEDAEVKLGVGWAHNVRDCFRSGRVRVHSIALLL